MQTPPPAVDAQPAEAAAGGLAVAGSLKASRAVADLNALNIRHKVGCRFIYVLLPWLWMRVFLDQFLILNRDPYPAAISSSNSKPEIRNCETNFLNYLLFYFNAKLKYQV